MSHQIKLPDYENCIANLPNSILKKWGLPQNGASLPLADRYLEQDYKNCFVLCRTKMDQWYGIL